MMRTAVFTHRCGEIKSRLRNAGDCTPMMASKSSASFVFSGGLVMREEYRASYAHGAVFSLYFSSRPEAGLDAVKLRFYDIADAQWNGFGPRNFHNVNGLVALPPTARTAAFALDGRFLECLSDGERLLSFADGVCSLKLDLPAEVHIGYSHNPMEACSLWFDVHQWSNRTPEDVSMPAIRVNAMNAAGLLGSLSFSGAEPEAFQQLNLSIAVSAQGPETWKIVDLMLCQPDIVLPPHLRRAIPKELAVSGKNITRVQNRYAKIRAGLAQYWDFCRRRWEEKGLPALLHPSIFMPQDKIFAQRDDILFSGPDLLFAPNLLSKSDICSCILPEGEWVHLWTSRMYPSGKVTVHAPFGAPAIFYRAGSEHSWLFDSIRQIASRL